MRRWGRTAGAPLPLPLLAGLLLGCRATRPDAAPSPHDDDAAWDTAWSTTPTHPDGDDTAAPPDTAPLADTAAPTGPCEAPPVPGRGMGLQDILERLDAQHCLAEADIVALEGWMDGFYDEGLYCDEVLRSWSPDGLGDWSTPEVVLQNASVPDIFIRDDGTHVLVYNDVTPGRLAEVIRTDPERLWRQGLVGLGGMGIAVDFGYGFLPLDGLDLHLPTLEQVVDPDIAELPDGTWRVAYFAIEPDEMEDGSWEPGAATLPHRFWRQAGSDPLDFPNAQVAVASTWENEGVVDPTILDVGDGSEILYAGVSDGGMPGWISPDGVTWTPDAPPDVVAGLIVTTPDATPDPAGGYRIYFRDNASGLYHVTFSQDGKGWSRSVPAGIPVIGGGVSVTVDPDGVWWMYFNQRDPLCTPPAAVGDPLFGGP